MPHSWSRSNVVSVVPSFKGREGEPGIGEVGVRGAMVEVGWGIISGLVGVWTQKQNFSACGSE